MPRPTRVAALLLLPLVVVPASAKVTRCGTGSARDQQLRAMALAALRSKGRYLVDGDAAELDGWPAGARPALVTERAIMASTSLKYTWSRASITAFSVTRTRTAVVLHAEAEEALGMTGTGGNTGVPPETTSRVKTHFTFVPEGSDWRLEAVRAEYFSDPYVDC